MNDFSIEIYRTLLRKMQLADYKFQTVNCLTTKLPEKTLFLRHDVDLLPSNSLLFATIQNTLSIKGTYYFRIIPESYNQDIIRKIANLGHEIGYHYETMDTCKGDIDKAYNEFCRNLDNFRKLFPVETICMHGSPLSKYDNRFIWYKYDYKKLGIIAEPYFDLNFNKIFYLTDTGRRWDGNKYSVRDKRMLSSVQSELIVEQLSNTLNHKFINSPIQWPHYHSTFNIIKALESDALPKQLMMTFHPQRWHENFFNWTKELVFQNTKNIVKRLLYV